MSGQGRTGRDEGLLQRTLYFQESEFNLCFASYFCSILNLGPVGPILQDSFKSHNVFLRKDQKRDCSYLCRTNSFFIFIQDLSPEGCKVASGLTQSTVNVAMEEFCWKESKQHCFEPTNPTLKISVVFTAILAANFVPRFKISLRRFVPQCHDWVCNVLLSC